MSDPNVTENNSAPIIGASEPGSGAETGTWGESHLAAHAELTQVRAQVIRPDGTTDLQAHARLKELNAFLYAGGSTPKHMLAPKPVADLTAPAHDAQGNNVADLQKISEYRPAERPEQYHLVPVGEASIEGNAAIRSALFAVGLSPQDGKFVFEEIVRLEQISFSPADLAEGETILEQSLRSAWGSAYDQNHAAALAAAARIPANFRAWLKENVPAVNYSPWLWNALARAGRSGK